MRHLRTDYNAIQPWPIRRPHTARVGGEVTTDIPEVLLAEGDSVQPLIPDEEPVFLLRAQDPIAGRMVRFYAETLRINGGDKGMCDALLAWADEMQEWADRTQHGLPDVPAQFLPAPGAAR